MPQSGDGDLWPTEDGDGAVADGRANRPPAPAWPGAEPEDRQARAPMAHGDQRTDAMPVAGVADVSEVSATAPDSGDWWGAEPVSDKIHEPARPDSPGAGRRSEWPVDEPAGQPDSRWLGQRPAWSEQREDQRPGARPEQRPDDRADLGPDPRQDFRPPPRPDQQRTLPVTWPEQSPPPRRVPPPPPVEATTVMRAIPPREPAEETTFLSAPAARAGAEWPPPEPPRAAPRRVGPEPEDDPEPPPRKNRRKPLLVTLIALVAVVGLAAGAVFLVPGLSDRLGLTTAEPTASGPPPAPVTFEPGLRGPDAAAPAPSAAGVTAALAGPTGDSGLGNLTGVVVDPANGQTLWESGADTPLVPASTTKLLTAAAALLSLDPTEELVTKVVEGATPGEVIIVGGGDLTVSSLEPGQESVYPGAAYLSDLVEQVRASGVTVTSVQVDLTLYSGDSLAPGWLPADINANGVGYITRMAPVMLDGDRADEPTNVDGVRTGNPGRHIAEAFAERIGASVPDTVETTAPANARVLGEIRSAPLVELVYTMLTTSDNMLAEVVAHEVARGAGQEVSFAGGAKATMDLLRQNGFNVDGAELSDGSGMSTQNQVPARLLAEILSVAAAPDGDDPRTAKLRPLLAGLPVAGGTGTLDDAHDRFGESDTAAARGWARAKTGTLSGVNSLAGLVLDKDGRVLVFAFMTSDSVSTTARPALDAIVAALRGCGCQ